VTSGICRFEEKSTGPFHLEETMMRRRSLAKSWGLLLVVATAAGCGEQAETPEPAAVPAAAPAPAGGASMVEEGRQIYAGAGICFTCHGADALGTPLAPNLTDDTWIWIEAPQENLQAKIVEVVRTGIPQPREHQAPMPPNGGASLTEDQLQAVATYVASL
jgi:mono/diheme cytochrome c family protein